MVTIETFNPLLFQGVIQNNTLHKASNVAIKLTANKKDRYTRAQCPLQYPLLLPRGTEGDIGITLLSQLQINSRGGNVGKITGSIYG